MFVLFLKKNKTYTWPWHDGVTCETMVTPWYAVVCFTSAKTDMLPFSFKQANKQH